MVTNIKRNTLRLPPELHEKLKQVAMAYGQTMNGLIRSILWEWVEKKEE